jgi:hypothetical protein
MHPRLRGAHPGGRTGLSSGLGATARHDLHRRQLADTVELSLGSAAGVDGVEARRAVAIICAIYDPCPGGWVEWSNFIIF